MPAQLLVRAPRGRNRVTALLHGTSLLEVRAALPTPGDVVDLDGQRAFSLPAALAACPPRFFRRRPVAARAALALVRDPSDLLACLLARGRSAVAGRLAAAFRDAGRDRVADELAAAMRAAGFEVRESNPFASPAPTGPGRGDASPVVHRLRLLWDAMRSRILERFPEPPGRPADVEAVLARIADVYVTDAYHSLSIEGYRVSPALIDRVRSGGWNPDRRPEDRAHRDALAARGYWQAHQAVLASVRRVVAGEPPGAVAEADHRTWYRELFAPSVAAGLVAPAALAGYRNVPVYIGGSMHTPPPPEAVRDAMPAFFELLREEPEPAVRVVLGHFVFVYVHPYVDGNGRIGRLLMNLMLTAAGYPWTVIPVERRDTCMTALEKASVDRFCFSLSETISEYNPDWSIQTGAQSAWVHIGASWSSTFRRGSRRFCGGRARPASRRCSPSGSRTRRASTCWIRAR